MILSFTTFKKSITSKSIFLRINLKFIFNNLFCFLPKNIYFYDVEVFSYLPFGICVLQKKKKTKMERTLIKKNLRLTHTYLSMVQIRPKTSCSPITKLIIFRINVLWKLETGIAQIKGIQKNKYCIKIG